MKKDIQLFCLINLFLAFILTLQSYKSIAQENLQNKIPTLTIKDEKSEIDLTISELKIDVVAIGNIATTTFDIIFYNPLPRQLEGEFNFPLAEGQNISRYALEVNGKMREGVVVEKKKARQAFENITRRNIDPGLIEKTKGNNYKTRIFPIPAKGYKRIIIAFDETLKSNDNNLLYVLPINYSNPISKFHIEIKVLNQEIIPYFEKSAFANINFKKWNSGYFASLNEINFIADKNIEFNIPHNNKEGFNLFTETINDKTYFYLSTKYNRQKLLKPNSKRIGIFWDISASQNNRDINKEIKILERYLNRPDNELEIELIPFNIEKDKVEKYKVLNGNIKELIDKIINCHYDGGTQLGILNFSKTDYDEILLFTDGLSTFGKNEITTSNIPIYPINSSSSADHSYLKQLALSTNGKYINLAKITVEESVDELMYDFTRLVSMDYDKAQISEVFKSLDNNSDYISLVGILKTEKAELKLNFGLNKNDTESKKILISKNDLNNEANIKRIWAQYKISHLDLQFEKNKDLITQLGKEFSIVTGNTSLLVLDRLQDYVEYEIVPPKELQKEYYALIKVKRKTEEESKYAKFNQAITNLKSAEAWWSKEFEQTKPKEQWKEKEESSEVLYREVRANDEMIPITRQQNVPPPPPPVTNQIIASDEMIFDDTETDQDSRIEIIEFDESEEVSYEMAYFAEADYGDAQIKERSTLDRKVNKIKVAMWESDAEYMQTLKETPNDELEKKYFELKNKYSNQPSFYIDVAHFMYDQGHKDFAIQVISNISEMKLENPELLRILGYFLLQNDELEHAILTFKEVLKIREEEPQSYRDLALAYAENMQYQDAVELFYKLITKVGNDRFQSITAIAINEMNNIISLHSDKLDLSGIDKRLISSLPIDIRIVINWSSNNSDIDLWVTDPYGEKCFYSNKETRIGGKISNDITQGYGPEEFCLKNAVKGNYKIKVNYYSNSRQSLAGPITVSAELYTNYGEPNQKKERISVRLTDAKEVIEIGQLIF